MFKDWNILVIGAGTMGHSIAQVFAVNGFATTLVDKNGEQLSRAREMITNNIASLIEMGEATPADAERAEKLLTYNTSYEKAASQANLVVETIIEDAGIKRELYNELDKLCPSDCILTSNTSALNIFDIAQISNPERLAIAHWFNPPHIMPLVEVVLGPSTSADTVEKVRSLLVQMGKKPAVIKQYVPGFIINRMTVAIVREAGYMVGQGWTTPEDIDAAIVSTFGPRFPFEGPMELADHIGWDVVKAVTSFLVPQLCSTTQGGNPIAEDLVAQGRLGVKSGYGLKDYSGQEMAQISQRRNNKIIKMLKAIKELHE